jgi:hypothetical protein
MSEKQFKLCCEADFLLIFFFFFQVMMYYSRFTIHSDKINPMIKEVCNLNKSMHDNEGINDTQLVNHTDGGTV